MKKNDRHAGPAALILLVCLLAGCGRDTAPRRPPPIAAGSRPAPAEITPPSVAPPASPQSSPPPAQMATPALDDVEELATQLISAERGIRSGTTDPPALESLARTQQAAYRAGVENPELAAALLRRSPTELRETIQANLMAGADLRALAKPVTKLPNWRIVKPAPAEELQSYYRQAEAQFGVPWAFLAAIHLVETRMGRIRGTSSAGAQGPMQFIPSTWAQYGRGDINNNKDAIFAAARYLKAAGAPANMNRALFAYNRSQRYVRAITAYANQMLRNERAYLGYYHWQVYVRTVNGDVLLEEGYPEPP